MLPLRFPGQPGSVNFSGVTVLGRGRPEVTQTGDPAEVPGPTLVWEPFWAEAGPRSSNTVLPLRSPDHSGGTVLGRGRHEVIQTGAPVDVPGPTLVWEPQLVGGPHSSC